MVLLHGENVHYSAPNTSDVSRHAYSVHFVVGGLGRCIARGSAQSQVCDSYVGLLGLANGLEKFRYVSCDPGEDTHTFLSLSDLEQIRDEPVSQSFFVTLRPHDTTHVSASSHLQAPTCCNPKP